MAFKRVNILRMTATITTFGFLPAPRRLGCQCLLQSDPLPDMELLDH